MTSKARNRTVRSTGLMLALLAGLAWVTSANDVRLSRGKRCAFSFNGRPFELAGR